MVTETGGADLSPELPGRPRSAGRARRRSGRRAALLIAAGTLHRDEGRLRPETTGHYTRRQPLVDRSAHFMSD